jgi:hypothetical protein
MNTRKRLMRMRLRLLLIQICAITAVVVTLATPSSAMTNGQTVSPEKWNAMILLGKNENCSGALIGSGWVLTAGHCLYAEKTCKPYALSSFSVTIGRTSLSSTDGAAYPVDRVYPGPGYACGQARNDVALLHLANFDSTRWNAIPLAFEDSVDNAYGGVSFFGYGRRGWSNNSSSVAGTLSKSKDGTIFRDPNAIGAVAECGQGYFLVCFTSDGTITRLMPGDSGGPMVRWVAGAWQLIAVADTVNSLSSSGNGSPAGATSTLTWPGVPYASSFTIRQWVYDTEQVSPAAPGTILRNKATGTSWLVASDGYRNWIPTGSDYNCLISQHQVISEDQILIDATPDRVGTWATCTTPQLWWEQETPNHPVNTFLNYHNASGMGTPIAAGQWVQVSCKVYDPYIASVNPDGYWYRIASSPWNNAYYAPANTFMNGDPYGGPYTHNTDFAVRDC